MVFWGVNSDSSSSFCRIKRNPGLKNSYRVCIVFKHIFFFFFDFCIRQRQPLFVFCCFVTAVCDVSRTCNVSRSMRVQPFVFLPLFLSLYLEEKHILELGAVVLSWVHLNIFGFQSLSLSPCVFNCAILFLFGFFSYMDGSPSSTSHFVSECFTTEKMFELFSPLLISIDIHAVASFSSSMAGKKRTGQIEKLNCVTAVR